MANFLKRILLGKPIRTDALNEERLSDRQALAIFGADALSSTTYATEEILLVLVTIGTSALYFSLPITLGITALVLIVALSYREVVHAYPQGGGVYNVAKANLGELRSLLGAASLVIDYILTVAVSVAAGIAALTSAFPSLIPYRVPLGILAILTLMWMNLRGVRSSGRIVIVPAYFFIFAVLTMIGYGLIRYATGNLPVEPIQNGAATLVDTVTFFVLLRAFSAGCAALTGLEAISNGVKAFQSPEPQRASRTIQRLSLLLGVILLGITFLAFQTRVVPTADETVVSQIARTLLGDTPFYYLVQIGTLLILFLAGNTPYADFPRLAALLARDGYWPKRFSNLGPRLVFSQGIVALSAVAILLLAFSGGYVHTLIPLYAVGVFLGFSITQLGMIVHHKRNLTRKKPRNPLSSFKSLSINAIGFAATSVVFFVVLFSKFLDGAWILLPMLTFLLIIMTKIRSHYSQVDRALSPERALLISAPSQRILAVILVAKVDRRAIEGARVARGLHPAAVKALHIAFDAEAGEQVKRTWENFFPDIPIEIRINQFREVIPPVLDFLAEAGKSWTGKIVAVVPMLVLQQPFAEFLHNKTGTRILTAIREDPRSQVEIYEVPVKLKERRTSPRRDRRGATGSRRP